MAKFYAVKGEENKIFRSWEECKFFLDGKKGYKYKSFSTKEEAEAYLNGEDFYADAVKRDIADGWCVAYTDGSFEEKLNTYSYGVLFLDTDGGRKELCGYGNQKDFISSRNVAGEVEGVIAAVKYAFLRGFAKLRIYHDYEGLSKWVSGEWGAKSPISAYYASEFSKYKGVVNVEFIKVKGHSNNAYNEEVDKLAKRALFDKCEVKTDGRGFWLAGTDEAKPLCERLNRLVSRAEFVFTPFGTRFNFNGEELNVYIGSKGITAITGDGGYMYFLAVSELLKDKGDTERIRIADRAFGLPFGSLCSGDGFAIAEAVTSLNEKYNENALLFALDELVESVKRSLDKSGIKYDKISSVFKKIDGERFSLQGEVDNKNEIEKAYNFLYHYRVGFADRTSDRKRTGELIKEAKSINGELDG